MNCEGAAAGNSMEIGNPYRELYFLYSLFLIHSLGLFCSVVWLAVFGDSKHTAEHTANQCSIEVPLEWASKDRIKTSCPLVPCLGRRRLLLLVEDPPRPEDSGIVCLLSCQSPRNKSNQCDCLLFCPPPVSQEPRQQQQQHEIRTFATCCRYLQTPPHVVLQTRDETPPHHTNQITTTSGGAAAKVLGSFTTIYSYGGLPGHGLHSLDTLQLLTATTVFLVQSSELPALEIITAAAADRPEAAILICTPPL